MKPGSRIRLICAAIVVLSVSACSTVDYGKPIDDFAAATDEAKTALSELNDQVTNAYADVLRDSIVSGKVFLKVSAGDCQTDSDRCRFVIVDEDGKEEPFPPEPALANMAIVMGQLSTYASKLRALLKADTAKKVEGQVNAALGSVQNLAQTVSRLGAKEVSAQSSVPEFATPVGAGVNWLVGQYVERVKLKGLRRATKAAKPVVREAADLFEDAASFASDVPKSTLAEEVSKANDAFRTNRTIVSLNNLAKQGAKYDALLTSTPPMVFKRLGDAHDALADKLEGHPISFTSVVARIEAFAREAEKLAKILKDIRAIGAKNSEG